MNLRKPGSIKSGFESVNLDKVRFVRYAVLTCESNLHAAGMVIRQDQLCASAAVAVYHIELCNDLLCNEVLYILGRELILLTDPFIVFEESIFDFVFKIKESNSETMSHFNVVNKISHESYLDIIKRLKEEKEYLDDCFYKNEFEPSYKFDDNYLLRFKNSLINAYYDKRFHLNVIKGDLNSYVDTAINLYSLAVDLENSVLDYYLYLASHSRRLLRNNDVESAIIRNIYDMYSPLVSLNRFEKIRKDFGDFLAKESNEFKQKYNTELLSRRFDYGFKGMIPNISAIKIFLNERCKNFIVENCLDNIINFDDSGLYDTRNYDLEVLCQKLSFEDIVDLYGKLKSVFSNIENSLAIPQRFICTVIYNRLGYDDSNNRESKMTEICNTYLKEDPVFL